MRIGYPMLYFLKFKDLTCNFCAFSRFFYFSVSFYPICMKILSKFRENVGLQAYRLGSVLNRSWTGLRTAVFSGLSQKNWEDRDRWSAWTGYSPVRFSVPFRSYKPDLEALLTILSILSILCGCRDPQFFQFFHFFEGVGTFKSFIFSFFPFFFFFISLMAWGPSNLSNLSNLWWCRGPQIFHFFHFFEDGQNTNTYTVNITRINVKEAIIIVSQISLSVLIQLQRK